jgi:cobalt-precorrin-5B (C1)-methyltransferase
MGDFVGGLLKYLRRHPLPRLTLGGGFAKMSKLAMGHLDLHSGRSQVDLDWLAERLGELGAGADLQDQARGANTANQVLELARQAGLALGDSVAQAARAAALEVLDGETRVEVLILNRQGEPVGRADG